MTHFHTIMEQLKELALSIHHGWFLKTPICFILGGFAFFFGASNGSILLMLVSLIAFDLVMGIGAAYAVGQPIESRRALKTATKLAVYLLLISAAYLCESIVPGTTLMDEAMVSFLALTEFISIMENAGRMGFSVPQKLLNQLVGLKNSR